MDTDRTLQVTRVLDDLRRIVRVLRESSRSSEQRIGVSGAQLFALKSLAETPRSSVSELAERTRTHQSTLSVVVKRLVTAGLVSRVVSAEDARRVELSVTKKGVALLARAPAAAQERLIDGIEGLSVAHRKALVTSLHALVGAMKLDEEQPEMFFEDVAQPTRRPRRA